MPETVPRIIFANEEHGYFAMEYLGEGFTNWKTALMRAECDPDLARQAMRLLAHIHAVSRGQPSVAREFETTQIFHELRTDPYLLTTARRHPALGSIFEEEAARLERTRECLVHGDFSPKNILFSHQRLVLLDCEVAWYGDPAFDTAFLLNHLCLKALYHAPRIAPFLALFGASTEAYFESVSTSIETNHRSARLLLMLLLARVDGKSPVEYLNDEKKQFIRAFVTMLLPTFQGGLDEVGSRWFAELELRFST
jgi:aminoglycoside phosphotransferase (APT) family kinase protein